MMRQAFSFRRFLGDTTGAAAVEFAIVANLFIAVLLGLFAIGYVFVVRADLEGSITAAERYALINEETDDKLKEIIRTKLATYDGTKITVTLARASKNGIDFVHADIAYVVDLGIASIVGPFKIETSRVFRT